MNLRKIYRHLIPLSLLLFLVLVVFSKFLALDGNGHPYLILHWDFASQGYPWLVYASDVIRSGSWPLWCPYVGGGTPFFINPQSQLYSPLTLLVSLLFGYSQYVAQFQSILLLFAGGSGIYALSFCLWKSRFAAIFSAICFSLTSAVFGNLEHLIYITAFALMPWIFWTIFQVIARKRWAPVLLSFFLYFLLVSGYPAIILMTLFWGGVWTFYLLAKQGRAERIAPLLTLIAAAALGLGLAAIHWLPILWYHLEFTRGSALGIDRALLGGNLSFKHLWGMVFHFLLSQPLPGPDTDISMRGVYFGAWALPLAVLATLRSRKQYAVPLLFFSVSTFLMACGGMFFGRVFLHLMLPLLNFSRFPAGDSRTLMALGLCLLAGEGAQLLAEDAAARRLGLALLAGLSSIILLAFFAFAAISSPEAFAAGPLNYLTAELLFIGLAAMAIVSFPRPGAKIALLLVLALDLGVAVTANIQAAGEPTGAYQQIEDQHQTSFRLEAALESRQTGYSKTPLDIGGCERANAGYLDKTFYVGEYNPLRLKRFDNLIASGFEGWLRTGARLVVLPADSDPRSFAEFERLAKPAHFQLVAYHPNRVQYHIKLPSDSLLVFNELYFPGWFASSGKPEMAMQEVAGGLRGLKLKAGEYDLQTFFRPKGFFLGLALSGLSFLFWLAWIAWGISAKRRSRSTLQATTIPARAHSKDI